MEQQLDMRFGPPRVRALTVTQLVRAISDTLEASLSGFWVEGEVSNTRIPSSGHLYFTLKDDRSSISAVMFRSDRQRLRFKIVDGMAILLRGRANLFESRGALQIVADEIEPRGVGVLQVAFEQLKRRLAAEGLFDASHKQVLPFLPHTIGIVTARSGAGLHDIIKVLLERYPNLQLVVRTARVQGDGAAVEIAEAISDLNRHGRAEVIIVGRGGGSLEDLWAFNHEAVARAIFNSKIPIVSAVGHEVDYTIADFVADLRAPTPTAAAHLVVPRKSELRDRVAALDSALKVAVTRELSAWRETVDDFADRTEHPGKLIERARERLLDLEAALQNGIDQVVINGWRKARELKLRLRAPTVWVNDLRHRLARLSPGLAHALDRQGREFGMALASLTNRLNTASASILTTRRHQMAELAARLDSISPLRVLERGYSVVIRSQDSRIVSDAATVEVGDELQIRLRKGRLRARLTAREA